MLYTQVRSISALCVGQRYDAVPAAASSGVPNRQPESKSHSAWAPTVRQWCATADAERSPTQRRRAPSSPAPTRVDAEWRTKRWAFSGEHATYERSARNVSRASRRRASTPGKRASARTWSAAGLTAATRRERRSVPVTDHGAFSTQRSRWTTAKHSHGRRSRSSRYQCPVDADEPAGEHASTQWTHWANGKPSAHTTTCVPTTGGAFSEQPRIAWFCDHRP